MGQKKQIQIIEDGLRLLGSPLDSSQMGRLKQHIKEIELFNDTYRLVNAKGTELAVKHVLDSLSVTALMKELALKFGGRPRCADVGSGGGFPGIPLAIAMNESSWSLIERSGKRAGFLENAIAVCNLYPRVRVINKDIKQVHEKFNIITFRAFASVGTIIKELDTCLGDDGYICAYKGKIEPLLEELYDLGSVDGDDRKGTAGPYRYEIKPVNVPFLDAQRHVLLLQRR
ncbi:MAG: 16S rRNA (guanine(527)-N(7))-methyltransferase RsmG [Sphaerochaetaceae bacterium]|nr:16S rRNA (guanine(527)-N(7))-methyltransferase RsmG [Sphaerochaetaceae bacterium]